MKDVIEVLRDFVKYDTRTNLNNPGKEVKKLLKEEFEPDLTKYGFSVEYVESNGHTSLLAKKNGNDLKVFLSGHVDVVPWDDRWVTDPQTMVITEENGMEVVKGRGVSDMKSGAAAILCALPEISKSNATVFIGITGDEEIGGENGTKVLVNMLEERNELPNYVITGDAAGMEIVTRRRNVFDVFVRTKKSPITITGIKKAKTFKSNIISSQTSHAAYFKKDIDTHCINEVQNFIDENLVYPYKLNGKFVKVNVIPDSIELEYIIPDETGDKYVCDEGLSHIIELGTKLMKINFETLAFSDCGINSTANVILEEKDNWLLEVDIRAMLDYKAENLDKAVEKIIDQVPWEFETEIVKSIGYIATDDKSPLVKAGCETLKDLGYEGKTAERGGATDGRFFGYFGIPTIDIGSIGYNVHGPNETAIVKTIRDIQSFFENVIRKIEIYHE